MSFRVIFASEARYEISAAAEWYEREKPGLGERFLDEMDRVVDRLGENPLQFPEVEAGVRRALLKKFPYGIYVTVTSSNVRVIAVLHMHRGSDPWRHPT